MTLVRVREGDLQDAGITIGYSSIRKWYRKGLYSWAFTHKNGKVYVIKEKVDELIRKKIIQPHKKWRNLEIIKENGRTLVPLSYDTFKAAGIKLSSRTLVSKRWKIRYPQLYTTKTRNKRKCIYVIKEELDRLIKESEVDEETGILNYRTKKREHAYSSVKTIQMKLKIDKMLGKPDWQSWREIHEAEKRNGFNDNDEERIKEQAIMKENVRKYEQEQREEDYRIEKINNRYIASYKGICCVGDSPANAKENLIELLYNTYKAKLDTKPNPMMGKVSNEIFIDEGSDKI